MISEVDDDDVISITFHVPPAPWSKRLPRWARCQRGDELLENLAADSYDDVSAEVMPWTILDHCVSVVSF